MLPWRRNKFVLAEDEAKGKPKSLSAGLTYHSIISSLVRSCPDLLPDYPFERLGSVFRTKRQKVELNKEEPTYKVRYLGNAVTLTAKGDGCMEEAVAKIWSKSDYGGQSTKMKLTVGPQGIRMSHDKGTKKAGHLYFLHRITYCAADARRPKIFAWVYRHQIKNKAVVLRCHAVLVTKPEKARAMALSLYQTSTAAFTEFKRLKRQNDFRHCQQQLLGGDVVPVMPLRRLLKGHCHYRPPTDNVRGAYQLGPITEEEEEEEDADRDACEASEKENEDRDRATAGPDLSPEQDLRKIVNELSACSISGVRCLARQIGMGRLFTASFSLASARLVGKRGSSVDDSLELYSFYPVPALFLLGLSLEGL
ncbi:protein FAM43B-like [Arapaima gigas]